MLRIGSTRLSRARITFLLHCLVVGAVAVPVRAAADAVTQAGSQQNAANVNHQGSDDDMDEATRNAMKAFMNLAALNIPGAISKGYEAYGNYINSEKLDDLEARTKKLKNTMTSITASGALNGGSLANAGAIADRKASGVTGTANSRTLTTLSRLDPSFLYKGETAAVAEEFEKRSGMKRDEFFRHLSAATDAQYTFDDPSLQSKLEQRFQAFKERIPNQEFRAGLERAESMVPNAIRTKMLGEAMAFYKNAWGSSGSTVATAPPAPILPEAGAMAASNTAAPTPSTAASSSDVKSAQRAPASAPSVEKEGFYPQKMGFYIGLKDDPNALNAYFQNANLPSDDDSIFKVVSLKYRKLTPGLVAKKNVGESGVR